MKGSKGITLVALIITIVVLMILAVVAITAISNNNMMNQAVNAGTMWNESAGNEANTIQEYENWIDNVTKKS